MLTRSLGGKHRIRPVQLLRRQRDRAVIHPAGIGQPAEPWHAHPAAAQQHHEDDDQQKTEQKPEQPSQPQQRLDHHHPLDRRGAGAACPDAQRRAPRDELAQDAAFRCRAFVHHAPAGQDRLVADGVDVGVVRDLQRQPDHLAQHPVAAMVGRAQPVRHIDDGIAQTCQIAFDRPPLLLAQFGQGPRLALQRRIPVHGAAGRVVVGLCQQIGVRIAQGGAQMANDLFVGEVDRLARGADRVQPRLMGGRDPLSGHRRQLPPTPKMPPDGDASAWSSASGAGASAGALPVPASAGSVPCPS